MWYQVAIAEPSTAAEPLNADNVKGAAKIDTSDDDEYLVTLCAAARAQVENHCGVMYAARSGATMVCDSFDDLARLPQAPVNSVSSITYTDTSGATQTLATSVYQLRADGIEPSIVLKYGQAWPPIQAGSRITVTAALGFSAVPPAVFQAMLLLLAHWYEQRQAAIETNLNEIPFGVECLLANYRRNP